MDCKVEACAECTRSCLSLHRTKLNPYPIVSSFFKVMFGKQFSEELIVPPRFARTLISLEGKKTFLEDSTGQKWDVHLSKLKGSLIFQRGWHEFSLDHGIELGDFVIFHYITGSHFNVQIFTRNGCERPALFSDKNYQNRRSKNTRDSVASKDSDGTSKTDFIPQTLTNSHMVPRLDLDRVQRQDNVRKPSALTEYFPIEGSSSKRAKLAPTEEFLEEPYILTSRSTSFSRDADRDHLFDLSVFEMPTKKVHSEETSIIEVNISQQGINQSEGTLTSYVDEACLSREEPILMLKSSSDIDMSSSSNVKSEPFFSCFVATERVALSLSLSEFTINFLFFPKVLSIYLDKLFCLAGPTARMIKKEPQSLQNDYVNVVGHDYSNVPKDCLELCASKKPNNGDLQNLNDKVATDEGFLKKLVKPEPIDFCYSKSAFMTKITCSEQHDGESFLELPECLPIKMCRKGAEMDQKLILLRDSAGKRWPVIYQEKKDHKILAHGWKEFKRYNSVQPGDQCTFVLENLDECIFNVDIVRVES